jgi:porphobilinogen deaminase
MRCRLQCASILPEICFVGGTNQGHPCQAQTCLTHLRAVQLLAELNHEETHIAVLCERAFLAALDGSCRTPIAGHGCKDETTGLLTFQGLIATTDGKDVRRGAGEADFTRRGALELGRRVGDEVKAGCGPEFFDWEEAQQGLKAPVQEKAATSA